MKLRLGTPKYARTASTLFMISFGLILVSRIVGVRVQEWMLYTGCIVLAAGLAVSVAGVRAERRAWEMPHKPPSKGF